jgi:hypothetical protein
LGKDMAHEITVEGLPPTPDFDSNGPRNYLASNTERGPRMLDLRSVYG